MIRKEGWGWGGGSIKNERTKKLSKRPVKSEFSLSSELGDKKIASFNGIFSVIFLCFLLDSLSSQFRDAMR